MSATETSYWPTVRLGDIGQSLIGLTYSPSDISQSGTLVLRSSNIQDGRLTFDNNVYVISPIPDRIKVREGDILICVRNGSRRLIGKSVMLDYRVAGQTFGAFMTVYRSPYNKFLQYFFESDSFKRQVDEHLGATINQITNASLNSFVVALPTVAEQDAIANILANVDYAITLLQRLIAKKQAIKQGVMQQLLTGRTRLPGFTNEWKTKSLGEDVALISGHHVLAQYSNSRGVGIPYLTGPADFPDGRIRQTKFTDKPSSMCQPGDILITVKGSGAGTLIEADASYCISRQLMAIRANVWNSRFLLYSLRQNARRIKDAVTGLIPGLSRSDILNQTIPVPSVDEQEAIAAVLSDIDADLDALDARLAKARVVKVGMMQQLLSGRIRLPIQEAAA